MEKGKIDFVLSVAGSIGVGSLIDASVFGLEWLFEENGVGYGANAKLAFLEKSLEVQINIPRTDKYPAKALRLGKSDVILILGLEDMVTTVQSIRN